MLPQSCLAPKNLGDLRALILPAGVLIALLSAAFNGYAATANQFNRLTTYPTGGTPATIGSGDFNRDGKADIVVLNGNGVLSFAAGTGTGTFNAPKTIATLPSSSAGAPMATGDFNGDGNEDIVLLPPPGNAVKVFFGHGDGTFAAAVTVADGLASPGSLVTGDFNNDGRTDILVADKGSVSMLLGDGNGTFGKPQTTSTGLDSSSNGFASLIIAVADVNLDSHLDVAVTDGNGVLEVLLGSATAALHPTPDSTLEYNTTNTMAMADFDGDGKPDLALGSGTNLPEFESSYVCFFSGNGDGTFNSNAQCPSLALNSFYGMMVTNLNGKPGLAIPNDPLTVLVNNGTGAFSQTYYATGGTFALADFDGDHRQDIVSGNSNGVQVILNSGAGMLRAPLSLLLDPGVFPTVVGMNSADMNHDGHADLIVDVFLQIPIGGQEPHVSMLLGGPRNTFNQSWDAQLDFTDQYGPSASPPAVGDFNGDGLLDFAYSAMTSENPPDITPYTQVFFGDGRGNFGGGPELSFAGNYVAAGYFNAGGQADLASVDGSSLAVLIGKGDGTFAPSVNYGVGNTPVSVLQRDLNGDGIRDLVVVNQGDDTISVLMGNGNGTFKPGKTYGVGKSPSMAVTGDFNRDGKIDIAVGSSDGVSVLLGNGNGSFQPQKLHPSTGPITGLAQASVRQDGIESLLGVDSATSRFVLFPGLGNGTFGAPVFYPTDTVPSGILVADFDGDGATDIALLTGGGPEVFYNQGGDHVTLASSTSKPKANQSVTFTAQVTLSYGETGTATGKVTFKDGTRYLGNVTMKGGTASLSTTFAAGTHSVVAEYGGDSNFNPNHSATVTIVAAP